MNILALYRVYPDKEYSTFADIPYGAFIEPFYGGDNVHELVLVTDYDFRERLHSHTMLIKCGGRTDLKPLVFRSRELAQKYVNELVFGESLNN